jgi:transcription elongation factor GreA
VSPAKAGINSDRAIAEKLRHHQIWATVTLIEEGTCKKKTWQIVGEPEADASKGKISVTSPIPRALIGKTMGAIVEVEAPGGAKVYKIQQMEWLEDSPKRRE